MCVCGVEVVWGLASCDAFETTQVFYYLHRVVCSTVWGCDLLWSWMGGAYSGSSRLSILSCSWSTV